MCGSNYYWNGWCCVPRSGYSILGTGIQTTSCPYGYYWNGIQCAPIQQNIGCSSGYTWIGITCASSSWNYGSYFGSNYQNYLSCPVGYYYNGAQCTPLNNYGMGQSCHSGYYWNGICCLIVSGGNAGIPSCPQGFYWNGAACTPFYSGVTSQYCGNGYQWGGSYCSPVATPYSSSYPYSTYGSVGYGSSIGTGFPASYTPSTYGATGGLPQSYIPSGVGASGLTQSYIPSGISTPGSTGLPQSYIPGQTSIGAIGTTTGLSQSYIPSQVGSLAGTTYGATTTGATYGTTSTLSQYGQSYSPGSVTTSIPITLSLTSSPSGANVGAAVDYSSGASTYSTSNIGATSAYSQNGAVYQTGTTTSSSPASYTSSPAPICNDGTFWNGTACISMTCPSGYIWSVTANQCISNAGSTTGVGYSNQGSFTGATTTTTTGTQQAYTSTYPSAPLQPISIPSSLPVYPSGGGQTQTSTFVNSGQIGSAIGSPTSNCQLCH